MKSRLRNIYEFKGIIISALLIVFSTYLANNYFYTKTLKLFQYTSITIFIYLMFWIAPVILIIKYIDKSNPLSFLKININVAVGIKKGLLYSGVIVFLFLIKYFISGTNVINTSIGNEKWIGILTVGIFEEVPFRGYMLQKINEKYSFWTANIVTSIFFTVIHIPNWIYFNPAILASVYSAFIMSLFFGYVFKNSKSIWSVIILHSIYDLFTILML